MASHFLSKKSTRSEPNIILGFRLQISDHLTRHFAELLVSACPLAPVVSLPEPFKAVLSVHTWLNVTKERQGAKQAPLKYALSSFLTLILRCCMQMFLTKALMPLHKPKCVGMYHQQLGYCVTQVSWMSALPCPTSAIHLIVLITARICTMSFPAAAPSSNFCGCCLVEPTRPAYLWQHQILSCSLWRKILSSPSQS